MNSEAVYSPSNSQRYTSEPNRILHVVHSLRRGGAERVVLELSRGYCEAGRGVGICSLVENNEYTDECLEGVFTESITSRSKFKWPRSIWPMAQQLRRVFETFKPDVLQIHNATASIVTAVSGTTIPAVHVIHGYGDLTRSGTKAMLRRKIECWAFNRLGKRAITVSEPLRDAAANHFRCSSSRFQSIENGIDISAFPFQSRRCSEAPSICVVGTLAQVKRVDLSLEAFAALRERFPRASLRIVGDGPLRGYLESYAQDLGVFDCAEFLGRRTNVAEIMRECDIFWQLSESEGLPLAVLEAMSSGLPVVGFNVRGVRDVVVDGRTGFLAPFGDVASVAAATQTLVEDDRRNDEITKIARHVVETKYDRIRMVQQHLEILSLVVNENWEGTARAA
ncbi:MAG: glycosyltransferase [Planctomycetaceae bacterium]|nr:glycosyltransferase [Planctomycetales bacterium]MCB9920687.1 glycosyltransferase [Planctomycetaceae bacterium]